MFVKILFTFILSFFMVSQISSELPESLKNNLEQYIQYNKNGENKIGHILINDRTSGINQSTWLYVKKALEFYKEQKPVFIILELNTPGGEVFAAQNISDALKEMDIQYNIPVVCYINNWAISAGAMLAYSCRFIAITKDASMGAVEPVLADTTGETKQASEKINSAMRTDLANRARFFDRNPNIAEAMVDKDIILVLRHNEFIKLDNDSQILPTDELISPKGKLLTLDSEKLMKYHVADFLLMPTKLPPLTESEIESGKWPAAKSAIFSAAFFDKIPNAEVEEYKPDWKTNFFIFLANPLVASALFMGMMIGFYMEFNMPGASLPGTVGFICLLLIIISHLSLEIGNVLELILLIVGLAVIAVELFILPTFGLLGFVGVALFLIGLFGLMLPGISAIDFDFDSQKFNVAAENFFQRLAMLSATFFLSLGIMALLSKYVFPGLSGFDRFVLKGNEQTNYLAVASSTTLPPIGTEGTVFAPLRPAGKVLINQNIYDALSLGAYIEQHTIVEVVGFESGNIVVNTKRIT
jgi:membrane-bound ClpP family serine protease